MTLTEPSKHMKQHVKPVLCPKCEERRAEQRDMQRHFEVHQPQATRPRFHCPYCDSQFTREDNVPRHLQSAHGVEAQMYGLD